MVEHLFPLETSDEALNYITENAWIERSNVRMFILRESQMKNYSFDPRFRESASINSCTNWAVRLMISGNFFNSMMIFRQRNATQHLRSFFNLTGVCPLKAHEKYDEFDDSNFFLCGGQCVLVNCSLANIIHATCFLYAIHFTYKFRANIWLQ